MSRWAVHTGAAGGAVWIVTCHSLLLQLDFWRPESYAGWAYLMGIMCTLKTFWIWTPTAYLYLSVGAPDVPHPCDWTFCRVSCATFLILSLSRISPMACWVDFVLASAGPL